MMNLNFEDDYLEPIDFDKKHDVSNKTLNTLEKVMFTQDDYGISKYKKALSADMDYDWLQMFLEEMADGLKYIQNEMDRKEKIKMYLEDALKYREWAIVEIALKTLSKKGTGK